MAEAGGVFTKEYTTIIQKLVNQVVNDPATYRGAKYLPSVQVPSDRIYVDVIEASGGLTSEHVLGTSPKNVAGVGSHTQSFAGGAWKESLVMNEADLLRLRQLGASDPSMRGARQFINFNIDKLNRRLEARIEKLRWDALLGGAFSYMGRTISFGVPGGNQATPIGAVWSADGTTANAAAKPLVDLRYWLLGGLPAFRKYMVRKAVMNPNTARWILDSASVQSLIQYRFAAENFQEYDLNRTLQFLVPGLPEFEIYSGWYQNESLSGDKVVVGDAAYFIPDGYILFEVSNLPGGDMYGEFVQGLNLATGNVDSPGVGKYLVVEDNTVPGSKGGPQNPYIELVSGVHGGPKIDRPFDLITAKVIA